jgi:quinol monooxygenase YgiN
MCAQEVTVLVQMKVRTKYHEAFVATLLEIIERSRVAPGCISYELFRRMDDNNTIVMLQTWASRQAFETNWLYTDAPRINAHSQMLEGPTEAWELQILLQ